MIGLHMGITKGALIRMIREKGAAFVMGNVPAGMSDDDVVAELAADPRTMFTGPSCDNQGPDGACRGHRSSGGAAPSHGAHAPTFTPPPPLELVECDACAGDGAGPNKRTPCATCAGTGRIERPSSTRGRK